MLEVIMPDKPIPYWCQTSDQILSNLKSQATGLTSGEAATRLANDGPNALETREKVTPWKIFWNQFNSPIIWILLFATGLSALLQDWVDAIIILVIVLGSAALSFSQEYSASTAVAKLKAQVSFKTNLLRDGNPVTIPADQVVRGDVVLLSAGSLVPADGVVLEAHDFFVNQAVLTGETFPVEKIPGLVTSMASLAQRTNTVFMGTSASSGSAKALVVQTGTQTAFGQIAERLTLRPPETEFERGIRHFGMLLTEVTLIMVIAVFAINVYFQKSVIDSLLFSVALAVGLTPQLLPAIININLSKGAQVMAAKGVIVRRLAAIENFGSMDILCTDKTGTLTEGVVKLDGALDAQGQPSEEVFLYTYLNSTFQSGLVNPLDQAIVSARQPDISVYTKKDEIPYDFIRKRLSVVVGHDGGDLLITKGAFEPILEICSQLKSGAELQPLDNATKETLEKRYADWSSQGYRVLGVATRAVPDLPHYDRTCEEDLVFAGFLLFFDPPKSSAKETLHDLKKLGVSLKIITGDNKLAAAHTALAVGIEDPQILTGADLGQMRDEALWQNAERIDIFAEVDPNQKEHIITALRKMGHVVGYMGDGINDAPSLHAADVGISVDSAVDVAKEAADFVLLKQDLEVLVDGIEEGRTTFANTMKYIFMATSANFGNMFSVAGASLFLPFLPMLPKQILLINFLTDLPEMSIASDNVDQVMIERPRRMDIHFIRRFMFVFGLLSSIFDFATFGVLYLLILSSRQTLVNSEALFHTGWFIESVLSATLVVFAIRTRLPILQSRPGKMMIILTSIVIFLVFTIPYSPLAVLLEFVQLPPLYLAAMVAISLAYFISAEITKRIFYLKEK
jgi:P-type Mg2+ transporter